MGCCILHIIRKNQSIKHLQYQTSSQTLNISSYQIPKQATPNQDMNKSESCYLANQNQLFRRQQKVTETLDKDMTKSTFFQEQQKKVCPKRESTQNNYSLVQQKLQGLIQQQSNILKLIQTATTIDTQHLIQLKRLYLQQIDLIQKLKTYCSDQSLQELKAYIYSRLTDIAISQKNHQKSSQYFHKAIEAYNASSRAASIQQRITLLNNYSVYKRSGGQVEQAIKYLKEAVGLMSEYFLVGDDRKYLGMINLGCLEYESGGKDESRNTLMKILSQCKNEAIVQLAKQNYKQYSGIDIDDLQF